MSTAATLDSILKELYRDEFYHVVTYQNRPALATLPKREDFKGRNMRLPLRYANAMGRSATFSTAQTNITSTKYEDFVLTRVKDYALARIDGEGADAADGGEASFVQGVQAEVDSAMDALADSIESALFGTGTGTIGNIASTATVASKTLLLANISQITNFELGQVIGASSGDGSGARTGTASITGIDRNLGTITTTVSNWSTQITALAVGDYLFVSGDTNLKLSGFPAWLPATAPSATTFFSVDRTADLTRLGGNRFDGSSGTVEEALIDGQSVAAREGGRPDTCFINNADFRKLQKTTGSRVQYPRGEVKAKSAKGDIGSIGFESLVLQGDYGLINIIAAPKCPSGTAYMLQLDTWVLATLGKAPKILMRDGSRILRVYNDDSYEVRTAMYGQLGCMAPGYNVNVVLPS